MKKLVTLISILTLSTVALAAKSDDVLQNIPGNGMVADASATGTKPQQEMTPAGPAEKPTVMKAKTHKATKKHTKHKKVVHKKKPAASTQMKTSMSSETSSEPMMNQPS